MFAEDGLHVHSRKERCGYQEESAEEVKGSTAVTPKKRVITGTITDKQKGKLPGVSVYVKGTTVGVVTDVNGVYKLELPGNSQSVVILFRGDENERG